MRGKTRPVGGHRTSHAVRITQREPVFGTFPPVGRVGRAQLCTPRRRGIPSMKHCVKNDNLIVAMCKSCHFLPFVLYADCPPPPPPPTFCRRLGPRRALSSSMGAPCSRFAGLKRRPKYPSARRHASGRAEGIGHRPGTTFLRRWRRALDGVRFSAEQRRIIPAAGSAAAATCFSRHRE